MPFDAFLKIDGIEGESTDDKHKNEIEVESYSCGVCQPAAGGRSSGGGAAAQRADFQDFSVVKALDKASPKLMLFCATGEHIKNIKLTCCRASGDKQPYLEIKMEDCIVSSYRPGGSSKSGSPLPLEEVSFNYGKITYDYTTTDHATGKPGGHVTAGWDTIANKKI